MYLLLSSKNLSVRVLCLDGSIFLAILYYSVVMGFRYGFGKDYFNYLGIYENAIDRGHASVTYINEPAFYYLTTFVASLKAHYTVFFGLIAFIQIYFLALAFKDKKHILKYVVLAFFALQLTSWMNGLRQITSVAIFIYAIESITNRNWIKYYLLAIFAAAFHNSAVLLFIAYPIFLLSWHKVKWNEMIQIGILLLSLVCSLGSLIEGFIFSVLGNLVFFLDYDHYITYSNVKLGGRGVGFLIITLINIIVIFFGNRAKDFFKDSSFSIFYALFYIGTIWTNVVFPSIVLDRPNYFMQGVNFVAIGYVLYYLKSSYRKNLVNQVGFYIIITLLLLLVCVNAISLGPGAFKV